MTVPHVTLIGTAWPLAVDWTDVLVSAADSLTSINRNLVCLLTHLQGAEVQLLFGQCGWKQAVLCCIPSGSDMGSFRRMLFFIGQMSVRFFGFWLSSWSNRLTENTLKNMRKNNFRKQCILLLLCVQLQFSRCGKKSDLFFFFFFNWPFASSYLCHFCYTCQAFQFHTVCGWQQQRWIYCSKSSVAVKQPVAGSWFQAVEDKISLLVSSLQLLILLAADHCKALWIKVQYTCRLFTFIFHLKKSIIEMLSFLVSIILICLFYIVNIFLRMSYNSSLYVLI